MIIGGLRGRELLMVGVIAFWFVAIAAGLMLVFVNVSRSAEASDVLAGVVLLLGVAGLALGYAGWYLRRHAR